MPYAKEQTWKCNICKGEVIVDKDGEGDLVCCGEKMELKTKEVEPPKEGEPEKPEEKEPTEPPKPA
ncbi:MAG: hypothetical protein ISS23_03650 [Nanoarchaeota archaeon]|nr:hypothetical protein [Nanoarchaeota archaeon]